MQSTFSDFGQMFLKETNEMIGKFCLTLQGWRDPEGLEIGYLFQKVYWHNALKALICFLMHWYNLNFASVLGCSIMCYIWLVLCNLYYFHSTIINHSIDVWIETTTIISKFRHFSYLR